jgi:hypothetical protein
MLQRSTWIVLGIFALLVLGVFLWQRFGKVDEPVEPTPTVTVVNEMVYDLGEQSIAGFNIVGVDGLSISFERDPVSITWIVKDQPAELADSTQIETAVGKLSFLLIDTKLTTQPPLDSMGLDQPTYMITLILSNGEQIVLNVGDLTPTGTGYYVRVDNNPAVVVAKTDLDSVINLLKTPPLAATYTPTVTMTTTSTPTSTKTVTSTPQATSEPEVATTPTP